MNRFALGYCLGSLQDGEVTVEQACKGLGGWGPGRIGVGAGTLGKGKSGPRRLEKGMLYWLHPVEAGS